MADTHRDGAGGLDGLDDLINAAGERPAGATESHSCDEDVDATPLKDDTTCAPLAAAVNPVHSSFVFARFTTSFDVLVSGLRALVSDAAVEASATQRALAADVTAHLDHMQYLASRSPVSMGLQAVAHEAAGIYATLSAGPRACAAVSAAPPANIGHGGRSAIASAAATEPPATGEAPPIASAYLSVSTATPPSGRDGGAAIASSSALGAPATGEAPPIASASLGVSTATPPSGRDGGAAIASSSALGAPAARAVPSVASSSLAGTSAAEAAPVARLSAPSAPYPSSGVKKTKVNQRIIKLQVLPKDFDEMLAAIRGNWTAACPERGTPPLRELVAGTERRATIQTTQVFSSSDSCLLSKYKKLAEEAEFLGGWGAFDECMRAERDRWKTGASTEGGAGSVGAKRRAFRWAEIVAFVNKRARERIAAARKE
ncbi:hypothetical protein I4F81_012847 [Pyropia yezoensis]|uniref:Uncharacterized protein n=1 Tax=Pyropia yezoensis TaxID=2788 RepID=A0ACC3CJV6_PYRYE|nr:hypothetical protein I4F81_012847 [Neopyropia yezoensis]